jgi:hypothetical protein
MRSCPLRILVSPFSVDLIGEDHSSRAAGWIQKLLLNLWCVLVVVVRRKMAGLRLIFQAIPDRKEK